MEFKKYKIEEIGEVIGGGTPSTKKSEYYGGNIPWITPKDLSNFKEVFISEGERNITEEGLKNSSARTLPSNTVLMTSRAPIGYLAIAKNEVTTNQGFKSIICNESLVKPLFLYYTLKNDMDKIKSLGTGSTFSEISGKVVKNIEINLPSIEYQTIIEYILGNFDKKIELNQKIIANLEELSQTIFKRWFVDFEFPDENGNPYKSSGGEMVDSELGMIPKGWEIITINDFANNNVITGKTPSTKIKENYSETGIPFLTIPDMHNDIFALNTERYISELGIEKLSKKVLPKNSLSISCIATPGLISIIANDTLTNQQINSFTPSENALYYLYFKLKGMKDYIRDLGSGGSATLNLNKTQFSKIKLVKPINEILYKYDKLVSPNFKMILNIQKEIQQLIQLRDTLLPKLMSGEIEIPDDIEVNEDELSI
ncbi:MULTISPECIES: restriction endonuclease subunit S [Staphylococcaceae]|uniref:restriction endonuclease subunit S n=1 Tax=Staphylococcaceae TaxID=90964 RepID=UPI001E49D8A5|nr:restriction endonuclease subunit S [Mammaliicoccus lentus]MCD2478781.1 restriction endonuclease subunit S [Mammaliicoccus lentus]MCD2521461.1 restriction endonuclease subunit S [Mammaliicoccus lentus]